MSYDGTASKDLTSVLRSDASGDAVRRYQRQLAAGMDKAASSSCGAKHKVTAKAFQVGISLLPVLWRDSKRR